MNRQDRIAQERQARNIFLRAIETVSADARAAFLEGACGQDEALRLRVHELLDNHRPDQFLEDPALKVSASSEEGGRIGRYKLLQKIGEGGMGMVYMAEQDEPVRRRVALKIIKLGMDTRQVVARFEAERQALALMDHPNIARVLDGGATETGRPYFVMELVQGVPITEFSDRNHLGMDARLQLFLPVCRAIQSAHQKGIIHRDLKPSNILVALNPDGSGMPKVIDFGVAKAVNQRLTEKTLFTSYAAMVGTPAYMSPEQAEMSNLDVDTRSDIYGLGVLLYELLTGTTPFPEKRLRSAGYNEMQRIILEEEPERPSTRLSTLKGEQRSVVARNRGASGLTLGRAFPSDLDWIVMKCLEKDRVRRYETANGLARDLERLLHDEPVLARPPSAGYRFCKFVRRNQFAVSVAGLVLLVLVLGVLASTWQAIRATRAVANEAKQRAAAQQELYNSLLAQAHTTRLTRQVGYRDRVFALLQRAKALDIPEKNMTDVRCEASACLGDFVGLTPATFTNFAASFEESDRTQAAELSCLDGSGHLAAFALADGTILLCDIQSGRQVARLSNASGSVYNLCLNDSGDHLFAVCGPKWDNWGDSAAKRRVCTWACDAAGVWNKTDDRAFPGANGLFNNRSEAIVEVIDVSSINNGHLARYRQFSLASGAFRAGYEVTNCLPQSWSFWVDETPDGRLLAVETVDTGNPSSSVVLNLYDWKTGRIINQLSLPTFGPVFLSEDGKYLGSVSPAGGTIYAVPAMDTVGQFKEDFQETGVFLGTMVGLPMWQQRRVRLWDLVTKEDVALLDEPEVAAPIAFSADGRSLLTAGQHHARLYRLKTPEKLELPAHAGVVPGVAFSPDGSRLVSIGRDRVLQVCDALTGRILWRLSDLPASGQCVCYSPNGDWLATGDYDTDVIRVWDAQSGKRLLELGTNNAGLTFSLEFSPDGHWLAAAGRKGVRLWALERAGPQAGGGLLYAELVKSFAEDAVSLMFAPDSRSLAFFSPSNLYLWHLDTSGEPRAVSLGTVGGVQTGTPVHLWHFDWLLQRPPVASGIVGSVQSEAFTPDGQEILTSGPSGEIATLDVRSGKRIRSFRAVAQTQPRNLALSPDGSRLALASAAGFAVDLWNPKTGQLLYSLPERAGTVYWLAWSPDSRRLAVARDDGKIAMWDLETVSQILTRAGLSP